MVDATIMYPTDCYDATGTGSNLWIPATDSTTAVTYNTNTTTVTDWYLDGTSSSAVTAKEIYRTMQQYLGNNRTATYKQWYDDDTTCWKTSSTDITFEYPTWTTYNDCKWHPEPVPTPGESIRNMMRQRQGPFIIGSRKPIQPTDCIKESRARETLLRVLGVDKFRSFLKHGFVSIRAKSGLIYQIFPGHGITAVYDRGIMVERLCVVLAGRFPPTDSIIMRYLLILNDESEFRKLAIPHGVMQSQRHKVQPRILQAERSLVEIYRELKAAA